MRKTFRVRYKMYDGHFAFVETSGEDINEEQAKKRAEDYLEANGRVYKEIITVYEVED